MLCARISRAIASAVSSFFLLVLKMCEKEAVLSALNAIMALNGEAGASNDSLEAMLTGVLEGRGKAAFDCFCRDIMSCIHGCFRHFNKVLPQLAKTRAHRDFHQARLQTIPVIWKSFASAAGLQRIERHNLQSVSRHLLDHCMEDLF